MKNQILIAMVSDNNYVINTSVVIASIIKNKSKNDYIKIHLLSDNISEKNKVQILETTKNANKIEIIFNDFNYKIPENICPNSRFPRNVYYRMYLGKLFPKYKKILYLDSDVIVLSSLAELFNMNINNYYIAGAKAREFKFANKRLKLPESNNYINSGVVLFNLDAWRKKHLTEKCIEYAQKNNPHAPNQDTTNFVCYKKIKEISPKWNAQIFSDTRKLEETYPGFFDAINNPYILHFLTREKPWHPYTKSYPDKHYYFDYLKFTPWRNYKIIYLLQKNIFYFKWSKNIKILRMLGINIIREFRGTYYFFGIPVLGEYNKIWKITATKI